VIRRVVRRGSGTFDDELAAQAAELRRRGENERDYVVRLINGHPVLCRKPHSPARERAEGGR
jgi:hypothetical protein